MTHTHTDTLIIGGGQAGLAASEHLTGHGIDHIVLERDRLAERWRTARWDSLVANGPAWHDRFPTHEFQDIHGDGFPTKDSVVRYFEEIAARINCPIRCGVDVRHVKRQGDGFVAETTGGTFSARNIIAATGPFQIPTYPQIVPESAPVEQIHSQAYHTPAQLAPGAVLVVGAGSSGAQIADELLRSGREVYLSVGPHDRPPRRYRGKDFVWWLGVLGKWQMKTPPAGREHVTIAVSGAHGGETVDFRRLAARGMHLVGMTQSYEGGVMRFAPDLADNIREGDANYLSVLDEGDAYVAANGLDLPEEPHARDIGPDPVCMTDPTLSLGLAAAGVGTIIWATGYVQDFGWLDVADAFEGGKPAHRDGVSQAPGVYFLGLPWLSMRGSSFIWGVWVDAQHVAGHIAARSAN